MLLPFSSVIILLLYVHFNNNTRLLLLSVGILWMQIHLLQDPKSFHPNQTGTLCTHPDTVDKRDVICRALISLCLQINGQWKGLSAGGCGNYKDSYKHNPIYQINVERPGPLLVELRGSRSG